jgi:magnesium-transporting ATPase (P-type)
MKKQLSCIRKFLISFTSVFTCVIIASTIFIGLYSNPYLPFRLIVQAVIIAAISSVLNFIYYSEKSISKKSMIFRTAIHFILLLSSVTGCALYFKWFSFENTGIALTFFGLFIAVYLIIWMANFLGDIIDEKIMNLKLEEYKARQK